MKLAVCFYGQPRYYEFGYQSTKNLYKNCEIDYYAHFWGDEDDKSNLSQFFNSKNIIIQPQVSKFKKILCEPNLSRISKDIFTTISPLYSIQQLHNIIKNIDKEYDFWILTRTDVGVESDFSLNNIEYNKNKIYSSYVGGCEWLVKYIDTKFIMCDKKNMLNLTNIYNNLDHYICDKKIPLCHHHLFFNSLLEYGSDMEMIMANPNDDYAGGWRWIRNNEMKIS